MSFALQCPLGRTTAPYKELKELSGTPPFQRIIHNFRIRLPLRSLHHLSDEKAEEFLIAASIRRNLILITFDNFVNEFLDRRFVRYLFESIFFYYLVGIISRRKH